MLEIVVGGGPAWVGQNEPVSSCSVKTQCSWARKEPSGLEGRVQWAGVELGAGGCLSVLRG